MGMSAEADFSLNEVIAFLSLKPLAGGGWGKDMAQSDLTEADEVVSAYRLLTPDLAQWRSLEREEKWTNYMGSPLQLEVKTVDASQVGVLEAGLGQWADLPAGCWLRVVPLGDWSLAGRIGVPEERLI